MTAPHVAQLLATHDIPVGSPSRITDPGRPEQSLVGHLDRPDATDLARAAGALTARLHVVPTDTADEPALPAASIGERIPAAEDVIAAVPGRAPRRIRALLLSGLDPEHGADGESSESRFARAETVLDGGVLAAAP